MIKWIHYTELTFWNELKSKVIIRSWDFSGGPAAKTPCSQCLGAQVQSLSGNLIPHATTESSYAAAAAAKSLQSCPTLCNPTDSSPPDSPVPGILQARTLEWVAISFSNAWKWKVKGKSLSHVRLFETPWTAAYQAPPSLGFSRQEHWSGLPFPSQIHEREKGKWHDS